MKTALSIIQNYRYRIDLSAPSSLLSLTDPDELQMLHLLYEVCEELRQSKAWEVQKKRYSFSTVADQSRYVLPADYYSPILNTHWNQSENNVLSGPASDFEFNWRLHGDVASSLNYTYRVFGGDNNPNSSSADPANDPYLQLEVNPTPASVQTLSFDYVTRDLFKPKDWTPSTAYNGSVTPVKVNSAGYNYQTTSNGTSSTEAPSGTANFTDNDITWTWLGRTPIETVTADTDLCIFDYDLVTLGLKARWTREKGGEYQGYENEFQAKINKAKSRYKGTFIGSMTSLRGRPFYHIPARNWSF